MRILTLLHVCFLITLLWAAVASPALALEEGPPVKIQIATAQLVSENKFFIPGEPFFVALHLSLPEGWHTYWQNPGDSGLPSTIEWFLPEGFTAGEIHWPAPKRIEWQGITNFGYSRDAYLLAPITSDVNYEGDAILTAQASWLVCKDICIPEKAEVSLRLRAKPDYAPTPDPLFEKIIAQVPKPHRGRLFFGVADKEVVLSVPGAMSDERKKEPIEFFPLTMGIINNGTPTRIMSDADHSYLIFNKGGKQDAQELKGVIRTGEEAWQIEASFDPGLKPPVTYDEDADGPEKNIFTILFFAVLGGIILNAMPCVFPILSLKVLKLVNYAQTSRRIAVSHGLAYTFGVIASFLLVASALIALQKGGESVGWGFQLQSPLFVTAMIFLLFLVGLNLSGIFTISFIGGNVGHEHASKDSLSGTFLTGVLATLVATPCTAPFMATALGYALSQPPMIALVIFAALGFGLALPYLLIGIIPAFAHLLPRPGAWMERFRQFLAFPIYATMVWLFWVLSLQTNAAGLAAALSGLVILAMIVWICQLGIKPGNKFVLILLLGFGLVYALFISRGEYTFETMGEVSVAPYSKKTLDDMLGQKQAVFVDATAAWCLTCKVNEAVALSSPKVHEHFVKNNIIMLVADWTKSDPEVTEFLKSHQRQGVPLYVYYSKDGKATILPQLLTPSIVIEQTQ